ncbi:MAG: hypothetical protein H7246_07195, partial [Phycisphaerae bacterium]|nr:hypothetical protein [Saprospiraceae bacterium]
MQKILRSPAFAPASVKTLAGEKSMAGLPAVALAKAGLSAATSAKAG